MGRGRKLTDEERKIADEKRKEYLKEYNAKPESKAKIKKAQAKYRATPENKAKRKEYDAIPENKAKAKEAQAKYNAKQKEINAKRILVDRVNKSETDRKNKKSFE